MGGTKSRKGRFQLVSCGSPLAAHTQHPDTGYQMQRFRGCFSRGKGQGKVRRFSCPSQRHPGGRGALHGPVRCQPDSVPGQQRPADQLDSLRLQHGAALGFGPLIHGEHAIGIGGRRDDRDGPAGFRQCPGQTRWPRPGGRRAAARQTGRTRPARQRQGRWLCSCSGARWPARRCPAAPTKIRASACANCVLVHSASRTPSRTAAGNAAGQVPGPAGGPEPCLFL